MTSSGDLPARDLLLVRLGAGRDNALPIGWYAEHMGLTRREIEQAVQQLRLDGYALASGPDGIWLGDVADMAVTLGSLRGRMRAQYTTMLAVRRTYRRMMAADAEQTSLWDAA